MIDTDNLTPVDTFLCPDCEGTKGKEEYIGRNERRVFYPCENCGGSGIVFKNRKKAAIATPLEEVCGTAMPTITIQDHPGVKIDIQLPFTVGDWVCCRGALFRVANIYINPEESLLPKVKDKDGNSFFMKDCNKIPSKFYPLIPEFLNWVEANNPKVFGA